MYCYRVVKWNHCTVWADRLDPADVLPVQPGGYYGQHESGGALPDLPGQPERYHPKPTSQEQVSDCAGEVGGLSLGSWLNTPGCVGVGLKVCPLSLSDHHNKYRYL